MAGSKFERKEVKFLVNAEQRKALTRNFPLRMAPDEYGKSTICNIYYDTPDFRLVRRSMEKPVYKEKLRLRSYGPATPEGPAYLELKKKYKGIVYKRRVGFTYTEAIDYMNGGPLPKDSQIGREIDWCRQYYGGLVPAAYICYDREAFFCREDPDLRITFDRNIRYRTTDISLLSAPSGKQLLAEGDSLMEIKAAESIPLWIVELLSRYQVRQVSFSKYGSAYVDILKGGNLAGQTEETERRRAS